MDASASKELKSEFCSLLVRNINHRTTQEDLFPSFSKFGKVVDISIPRSERTGKSRGIAYVRYRYTDEAERAIKMLNGKLVDGKKIGVRFADHCTMATEPASKRFSRDTLSEKEKRESSTERLKRIPISTHGRLTVKERTSLFMDRYMPMANQALDYYNSKQSTNMKVVRVCVAFKNETHVHINFTAATSDIAYEILLFAELKISFDHNDNVELSVEGCCVLEQVDCGNPLGSPCRLCIGEVIHPGPRDGYRIVSGDGFEGYNFWDYLPYAYDESELSCSPLPSDWQMFRACATKALKYFNFQQHAEFRDAKVVAGFDEIDKIHEAERKIHVNFMAKPRSSKEQVQDQLFFAELIIPLFKFESSSWEGYKADFIQVKGCCKLKRVDSGNPRGRMCGLCCGRVKHPGPTYGYCAEAGDQFEDAEFWKIGSGIF